MGGEVFRVEREGLVEPLPGGGQQFTLPQGQHLRSQLFGKEAVIIAEKANVKFEPGNAAVTHFTIYGGEKVILVEDKGQWLKVKRLDGKLGWIRKEELEII